MSASSPAPQLPTLPHVPLHSPPPPPAGSYPPFIDPSITSRRPTRVVMHVDMDCFYAQVESQRHPQFLHHPLGVIQNGTLCVTTNYHCRGRGLPKMGAPADFAALCPSMKFAGSDMVRYRRASREWARSFSRWKGVVVMKRSIDEAYLDLTAAVRQRIKERHLLTPVPHSAPAQLEEIANQRHARAIAAYKADEAALIARYGPLEPHLLESSGTIKAAVRASKSTDPITQLREQQRGGGVNWEENSRKGMTIDEKVAAMSEEQVVAMLEQLHPTDYCRAQKKQTKHIELVRMEEAETRKAEVAGVEGLKWRPWVGEVLLTGEEDRSVNLNLVDPEQMEEEEHPEAENDDDTLSSPPSLTTAPSPLKPSDQSLTDASVSTLPHPSSVSSSFHPPPTDFSLEDALNPCDDYLLCVGSQLAYEIRSSLYYQMGLTTSAGIAPNMMLAKLASSHNKPNQQSIVRRSIARDFISPFKLSKVSGFGPKANERVLSAGVVTVSQVQARTYASLVLEFGEKFGSWLYAIGQAEDETPVEVTGPPKSIGQSKRQKTQTEDERLNLLYWLASKLYERIEEDEREYHRFPTTLALGFINMGTWVNVSRRQPLAYLREKVDPVQVMYEMAIQLLKDNVPAGTPLRCLSLNVSNFVALPGAKTISSYFSKGAAVGDEQEETKEAAAAGFESVPLTAHPTIGPSFTFRYKEAKAKVKEKVGGGRRAVNLFVKKEKVRRIDHMPLVKQGPSTLQEELTENEVSVQGSGLPGSTVPINDVRVGSEEDDINALFGAVDDTSLASAPPTLPSTPSPSPPDTRCAAGTRLSPTSPSPASLSPLLSATSSSGSPGVASAVYLCDACNLPVAESNRVEHTDFHYAQQLQATVRSDDRKRREEEEESKRRQRKHKQTKAGGQLDGQVRRPSVTRGPIQLMLAQRSGSDASARARDIGSFFNTTPT